MPRSHEPLWWIPFAGGMMLDAMVMPALIVITGLLIPLHVVKEGPLRELLKNPFARAAVWVIISATFFHAAHRLRFALPDLGLRALKPVLGFLFYGGAIMVTIWTAVIAFAP